MISFGEDGLSGHPDHIAIGQHALSAFYKCKYVRAFYWLAVPHSIAEAPGMAQIRATPDEHITHTIDVSKVWESKQDAIRYHQTQLKESPILKSDQSKQRPFLGMEHFNLIENRPGGSSQHVISSDLLARLAE